MPMPTTVKPTQKAVKTYYAALKTYADQGVDNESALRSAFQNLLADRGKRFGWTLIPELALPLNGRTVQPDGIFCEEYHTLGSIPPEVFDRLGNGCKIVQALPQGFGAGGD
jgi:hypothetical protein